MNNGQEILEAVDERGEIGFIDQVTKPADAAAGENLLAVRLGNGETIFVEADRLTKTATDKFRYAGSFQDAPRRSNLNGRNSNKINKSCLHRKKRRKQALLKAFVSGKFKKI